MEAIRDMVRKITKFDTLNNTILTNEHPIMVARYRCDKCGDQFRYYKVLTAHKRDFHSY